MNDFVQDLSIWRIVWSFVSAEETAETQCHHSAIRWAFLCKPSDDDNDEDDDDDEDDECCYHYY